MGLDAGTAHRLWNALAIDFGCACAELSRAVERQRCKDSTTHRTEVAARRARIDDILDLAIAAARAGG